VSVLEQATLHVRPGRESAFEGAFGQARSLIEATEGCLAVRLLRGIESSSTYLLLVEWRSVEDHEVGFRGSPRYERWSELLHPFYDPFPLVEHFADC
jgi:heme-degrading monooxygenase HmoA